MKAIIHASSMKEAVETANKSYIEPVYIKVYRRASKGNSFYEFDIKGSL